MKVLVTGSYGMLAQDVISELQGRGHEVLSHDKDTLDILNPEAVEAALQDSSPDLLVNCAAWTAVDAAEENESIAFTLNAVAVQNLARAANNAGVRMVHVSTDYVFDGCQTVPYQADDPINPVGAYGRTKAAGEWAARTEAPDALIVRTAWLYGAGGNCFPRTLASLLRKNGTAKVVNDQFGQPTWARDVARVIVDLAEANAPAGIYHATSSGQTTWFDFTKSIAESVGLNTDVVKPTTSAEFSRPAPRPTWSVLGHDSLRDAGIPVIGDWKERWSEAAPVVLAD